MRAVHASVAQLVVQLIYQQVIGSSPVGGSSKVQCTVSNKGTYKLSVTIAGIRSRSPVESLLSPALAPHDPLAQLAEHLTFNQGVRSSNLRWVTIRICYHSSVGRARD